MRAGESVCKSARAGGRGEREGGRERGRERGSSREVGVKLYRVCRVSNPVQDGSNASNPLPEVT